MKESAIHTGVVRPAVRGEAILEGGRWIAASAFVYVVAWVIGLTLGAFNSAPSPTNSIQEIGAYYASHREAAMIQAYFLDGIAGVSLIVFAAALRGAFRRFESESATLSNIVFAGGAAAGVVSLLQGLFTQVLADNVAPMGNLAAIRALFDLNAEGDTYKLLALGVCIGATAILTLRAGILPRWLGWAGAVLAPLLVAAGWNFALSTSTQLIAYGVLLVGLLSWVTAIGVVSLRRAA